MTPSNEAVKILDSLAIVLAAVPKKSFDPPPLPHHSQPSSPPDSPPPQATNTGYSNSPHSSQYTVNIQSHRNYFEYFSVRTSPLPKRVLRRPFPPAYLWRFVIECPSVLGDRPFVVWIGNWPRLLGRIW